MPDGGVVVGNRDDISHKKAGSDDKITQKTVTEPVLMDTVKASYASKVVGDSSKSNKASHSFFGEEVDHSMRNALIAWLLRKVIGFKALHSRIHSMWKPVGTQQLIDIDNKYYVVLFSDEGDLLSSNSQPKLLAK
ncbi:hypothetical protein V6N11_069662 [Hibiscus sabdariffa]|uniref:DUF4283 domain-containing protein n=1 Tax=Hibiscus sabdariffa TaxID=183260 RepID=A0ABR2Q3F2_9ROSI